MRALIIVLLLTAGCGSAAAVPPGYEPYSNPQFGLTLNKPAGWKVYAADGVVFIKPNPDSDSAVFLIPIHRAPSGMQAVSFVRFVADQAIAEHPELAIEERRANAANTVAEVTARRTSNRTGQTVRGFYLVSLEGGRGMYCGYEAPAATFDRTHAFLKGVLKDLRISPVAFDNAMRAGKVSSEGATSSQVKLPPTIDRNRLMIKLSVDRTMYLAVPPDWTVGGGNYSTIATAAGGLMGITATNDAQPKTLDPYTYLMQALLPWYKCTGTIIYKREPNDLLMQFSRSQGYSSKAENFVGETKNGDLQRVYFWFSVNAATTAPGMGFVSTIGFFGVPELFERNALMLYAMAASMGPNQAEIMRVLGQNLDGLAQASRTISATNDLVIQTVRAKSAGVDRIIDKYNYYTAGEDARYSALENRIYVVDSNLERYAGNPNYPQEMLTSVPDALWNQLPHRR